MVRTLVGAGLLALLAVVHANLFVYKDTKELPRSIEDEFLDLPASFGPDIPLNGLPGYLVEGQPSDGCDLMQPPPHLANYSGKWFVLIARYNCPFEKKVRNAQRAGFDCAIVHNVNSSELETMSAKDAEGIVIPSVFVAAKTGQKLAQNYTYTKGYYTMVNDDLPFDINTHLLLPFAVVVVLCLFVILIFMIVKCIKDRRRARRHRLPNRALSKIPICKFSKGDPYDTCAICLDDYQDGDKLRVLPCAHAYHASCIDPWLTHSRRVCPVCKRHVLVAGEPPARSDSDSDDTAPLLPAAAPPTAQNGTFEEQSENPFRRAARFMARIRRQPQPPQDQEQASLPEQSGEQHNDGSDEESESAPLVRATVTSQSERRPHRNRRVGGRRARTRHAPPPVAAAPHTPPYHSPQHSINTSTEGEIGVAALPAPTEPSLPTHLSL